MTHFEIYEKLEVIEEKLDEYIYHNQIGLKSECLALQYSMAIMAHQVIVGNLYYFEKSDKICMSCTYLRLKTLSQALKRYLKIEDAKKEEDFPSIEDLVHFQSDKTYLTDVFSEIKDLSIKLSHIAVSKDYECKHIVNTAYEKLKAITPKREMREEEEDDDDDDI